MPFQTRAWLSVDPTSGPQAFNIYKIGSGPSEHSSRFPHSSSHSSSHSTFMSPGYPRLFCLANGAGCTTQFGCPSPTPMCNSAFERQANEEAKNSDSLPAS